MIKCQCEISYEEMLMQKEKEQEKWWDSHEIKLKRDRDGTKIETVIPTCKCESWVY